MSPLAFTPVDISVMVALAMRALPRAALMRAMLRDDAMMRRAD
jgi:hypothetical protein